MMHSRALPPLAILLAIGIFFVYIKPLWTGPIAAAKAAIASDNLALEAAARYTAQQKTLIDARAQIDPANLARLSVFLPDSVDNVGIILDLNALAARSDVSLSAINVATADKNSTAAKPVSAAAPAAPSGAMGALPTTSTRANPVGSVDLSMTVVGTYAAFQTFLVAIEKSARLLDAKDITVKGSDTGIYTYQLTLRLYWLR